MSITVIVVFLLVRLIYYFYTKDNPAVGKDYLNTWRLRRAAKKGLTFTVRTIQTSEEDQWHMPILRCSVNGILDVAHENRAITCVVRFYDITQGESQRQLVYSNHSEFADENFEAMLVFNAFAKTELCVFTDFEIGQIPPHLLHCPYPGERTILAKLTVVDTKYSEIVFATHSTTFTMTEMSAGYVANREVVERRVRPVCDLIATILTRDVPMRRDIVEGVCAYLQDLGNGTLPGHMVDALVKTSIKEALHDAPHLTMSGVDDLLRRIEEIDDLDYFDMGELLCTVCFYCYGQQGAITDENQRVVSMICERFDVSRERMLELRDVFIRTHMYEPDVNPILAEMPTGLDRDEQIRYLNDEYRRWRQRVTNTDPEVVREATHRLELIASLRSTLSSS